MYRKRTLIERICAIAMAAILVVGVVPATVFAVGTDLSGKVQMGLGELIVKNYEDLSKEEQAIINTSLLTSEFVTFEPPTTSEGLVTVDEKAHTVQVAAYEKDGYIWEPVSVVIKYGNNQEEKVELTNGSGSFHYAGDDYSVAVTYEMYISVELDKQQALLDAPAYLTQGIQNMETIADLRDFLNEFSGYLQPLYDVAKDGIDMGMFGTIKPEAEARAAIMALYEEYNANGGKLKLVDMIDEYEAAGDLKVKYMLENGAEFLEVAKATYANLKEIHYNGTTSGLFLATAIGMLTSMPSIFPGVTATQLTLAMNLLGNNLSTMQPVVESEWKVLNGSYVKSDITDMEYIQLLALVNAAQGRTNIHTADKEKLLASSVVLEANVNRYDVNVSIVINLVEGIDSKEYTAYTIKSETLKVRGGSTVADVLGAWAAANLEQGVLDQFVASHPNSGVCLDNYDRTENVGFTGELTADANYVITYSPKELTVSAAGISELDGLKLPYGYRLTLPKYTGTDGQSYIYNVNGAVHGQGYIYRLTENVTISREAGAMQEFTLGELIANSYADMSAEAKAILRAAALNTTGSLMFMLPANSAAETVGAFTVRAIEQSSGIPGISWKATSVKFYGANGAYEEVKTNEAGEATTTLNGYDYALVVYEIELNSQVAAENIQYVSNLADTLVKEAKAQKSEMKFLVNNLELMKKIDGKVIKSLNMVSSQFSPEGKAAIEDLVNFCYDDVNECLKLVGLLNGYVSGGLAYYYAGTNREQIQAQVDRIVANLAVLLADPALDDILATVEMSDKKDDVQKVYDALKGIDLPAVNESIIRDASTLDLNALAAAVEAAEGKTTAYTAAGALKYTHEINVTAPDRSSVNLKVEIYNSNGNLVGSSEIQTITYSGASYTLTPADKAQIAKILAELEATLNVNGSYYVSQVTIPETVVGSVNVTKTWSPKTYDVTVGDKVQNIPYDDPTISLPGVTEGGMELVYTVTVGGISQQIVVRDSNSVAYTLTAEQLAKINDGITVSVKKVDRNKQHLEQTIEELNNALAQGGLTYEANGQKYLMVSFILVQDAQGEYSVVMRVNPSVTGLAPNAQLANIVEVLLNNGYIGMGGNDVFDGSMFYLQGVIDMLLNSGMSLQSVANLIDANGNITESLTGKNWTVIDNNANVENASTLGGLLFQSTLELGMNNKAGAKSYDLYVTIEDFDRMAGPLSTADKALNSVLGYANVTLANGAVNVNVQAPDRLYQAYTTLMLVMNYADIEDLGSADYYGMIEDLVKQVGDLISAEDESGKHMFTAAVIQDTVNKILSSANVGDNVAKYISAGLRYLVNYADVQSNGMEGTTYSASVSYELGAIIDKLLKNPEMKDLVTGMIAEYANGIHADFTFTLENIENTKYVAMVLDNSKSGLNKYVLVNENNFGKTLATCGNNAIVIMLDDAAISATTIPNAAFIDLNGKTLTVDGTLTAANRVIILDTTMVTDQAGTVNGTLAGNFTILAGRYTQDVSAFLKKGYSQKAGLVVNALFNVEADEDGYNVVINSDFLNKANIPNLQSLAIELVADLLLKVYNNGSLAIGEYGIYSIQYEDILRLLEGGISVKDLANEMLGCIDCAGITGFVNDFIAKITDFEQLAKDVEAGNPIFSYIVNTSNWDYSLHYSEDGSYLTGSLVKGDTNSTKLSFSFDDTNKAELVALLTELGKVVDSDIKFELENLELRGNGLNVDSILKSIDWSLTANVTVDLTQNPYYPALVAILLAGGGAENADALIEGVNIMLNQGYNGPLREALEKVPMNQIVSALKAVKGQSFDEILANVNGLDVYTGLIKQLEATYHDLLNVLYAALYRLGLNGGNATLGSKATDVPGTYAYTFKRGDLTASATLKLFGQIVPMPAIIVVNAEGKTVYAGNSLSEAFAAATEDSIITINEAVTLDADVNVDCKVLVEGAEKVTLGDKVVYLTNADNSKLTADAAWAEGIKSGVEGYKVKQDENVFTLTAIIPEPVLGLPMINTDTIIGGYKVAGGYIYLDVWANGITEAQFNELVKFQVANNEIVTTVFTGLNGELIANGAQLVVTATNAEGLTDSDVYTIIIMGDVNATGETDCGDAVLIIEAYLGKRELSEVQMLAADMNQNGELDSGDVVKNDVKYLNAWDKKVYISLLNNTTENSEDK